jgi:hypothetical protein
VVFNITHAMAKAATRVKSPTARPRGPRNSAAVVGNANTAGIPEPVKNSNHSCGSDLSPGAHKVFGWFGGRDFRRTIPEDQPDCITVSLQESISVVIVPPLSHATPICIKTRRKHSHALCGMPLIFAVEGYRTDAGELTFH